MSEEVEQPEQPHQPEAPKPDEPLARVPDNLKPHVFKPGQSGNPGGRPKGRTLLTIIRQRLSKPSGDDSELEEAAKAYIEQMCKGSFPHLKEYIDREEGKVPDLMEVKNELSGQITVVPPWFKRRVAGPEDPQAKRDGP